MNYKQKPKRRKQKQNKIRKKKHHIQINLLKIFNFIIKPKINKLTNLTVKALLYYKFINVLQKGSWLAKCKTQNANVAKSQMLQNMPNGKFAVVKKLYAIRGRRTN